MIYVTHDQVEAMTLADRIVVLDAGMIEQIGAPMDLYRRPANLFVAGFIGSPRMNFLDVDVTPGPGGTSRCAIRNGPTLDIPIPPLGTQATLGIRPEQLVFPAPAGSPGTVSGRVIVIERLGGSTLVHLAFGPEARVTFQTTDDLGIRLDDMVDVGLPPERCHIFGPDGKSWQTP
jgi:multiple sugar transport system ATP-binding protein